MTAAEDEATYLERLTAARDRVRAFVDRLPNKKCGEVVDNRHGEEWPLLRTDLNMLLAASWPSDEDQVRLIYKSGDRVEWNPTGDEWKSATVHRVGRVGVLILLDENGETLLAQEEHLRCETVASVRADRDRLAAELAELHTWRGLMSLLDEHWPADVFDGRSNDGDPGPRIVALMRQVHLLRTELEKEREERWVPVDESEDTWCADSEERSN